MKKLSLLFVMMLAFTVSTMAQSTLPKPATPSFSEFIDYGNPVGIDLGYDIPHNWMTNPMLPVADDYTPGKEFDPTDPDYGNYTLLDPEKVSFSLFTDAGKIFVFTPELFPGQVDEPMTRFPYNGRTPNGNIGLSDMHIDLTNEVDDGEEPFFTWRIGIQTYYTDNGETRASDIYYMEVYPQLKEAANVTPTSFLADWSCDADSTYMLAGFSCYDLYVINKDTQETIVIENVEPTNPQSEINEQGQSVGLDYPIPGATYKVENLIPGATYQYYVVCSDSYNSFKSAVREVTLPMPPVYILGEVNEHGWAPNDGELMEYDAEKGAYTATVNLDGRNEGYNYFSFTTELALYNDQGSWDYIAPFRFGAVSEGDFLVTDELLGQELSLTYENGHAFKVPAGTYDLTLNKETMKLIIEKATPAIQLGDVNKDGQVTIADVTELIDHLLSGDFAETDHFSPYAANVNEDTDISISDVTSLIDILLGM